MPLSLATFRGAASTPTPMEGLLLSEAWPSSTSAGDTLHPLDAVMTVLDDFLGPGPGAAELAPLSPVDLASFLPSSPTLPAFYGEERPSLMTAPGLSKELANVDVAAAAAASAGALMDPTLDSHYLSSRTGLFIVACSLHILDCNHALATLLGTTRSYLLGKRATELGIKGENPVARAALVQLMTGQKRTFITVERARKVSPPNEMHWIRCTVVALADGPMGMCQFIGVMEGIDEPLDGEQIQAL
jgi:PAS domain-containing protein